MDKISNSANLYIKINAQVEWLHPPKTEEERINRLQTQSVVQKIASSLEEAVLYKIHAIINDTLRGKINER